MRGRTFFFMTFTVFSLGESLRLNIRRLFMRTFCSVQLILWWSFPFSMTCLCILYFRSAIELKASTNVSFILIIFHHFWITNYINFKVFWITKFWSTFINYFFRFHINIFRWLPVLLSYEFVIFSYLYTKSTDYVHIIHYDIVIVKQHENASIYVAVHA